MRRWSGGPLLTDDTVAFTGTSRRQKVLARIKHHNQDEKEHEPLVPQFDQTDTHKIGTNRPKSGLYKSHSDGTETITKCVYSYEDRYMFNRIISGTDLLFDSHFESGNLSQAFRIGGYDNKRSSFIEYDLTLNHDVHSIGHTQWFYFSVSNMVANSTVRFNIGNFTKSSSLFNCGMMPLLYSEKNGYWCRCGANITYSQSRNVKSKKKVYILSFTHKFQYSSDKCYFAYSYPYTYSDLQDYLKSLQLNTERSKCFRRSLLSHTLGGNRCDVLTITEPTSSLKKLKNRKGILISARVHPGETVASWICQGLIDFLTSDSENAKVLRRAFVFKVIPMLNPDGVINGNYRTSLAGVDLNRRWDNPHKFHHPTVFRTKTMLKRFQAMRDITVCCDIHGHSRREGLFMYGCPKNWRNRTHLTPHTLPNLFDSQCTFFNVHRCTFRVQGCKASTMRIVMNKEFGIECSYTLESSLSGYKGFHFSIANLLSMGGDFCHALHDLNLILIQKSESFLEAKIVDFPDDDFDFQQPKDQRNNQLCSRRKQYTMMNGKNHVSDDSGGSDSNPSEDNMSESEALQLLRSQSEIPLKRRKKKKKCRKSKTTKKNMKSKMTNKRDSASGERVLRSCTVIQLGESPLSAGKHQKVCPNDSFRGSKKKKIFAPKQQKESLKSLIFPLSGP